MIPRAKQYQTIRKLPSRGNYLGVALSAITLLSWIPICSADRQPGGQSAQLSAVSAESLPAQQTAIALEPGRPIKRELALGQTHSYKVALSAGQFLRVIVQQQGIDIVATLSGPDGRQIIKVDSPNTIQGPEPVLVVADKEGSYLIELTALNKPEPAGRYEIKIEELRAATPNDYKSVAADRAFFEAEQLRTHRTAEASRRALEKYGEALPLMRDIGNRRGTAYTLGGMGITYSFLGENEKVLEYYSEAITLLHEIGDRMVEALLLACMADVYVGFGEMQMALGYYNLARPIIRDLGDRRAEETALIGMGLIYHSLGEWQMALEHYNLALPLAQACEDKWGEGSILNNIGLVHNSLGEERKALEYYNRSLSLRRQVADRRGEGVTLANIGSIYVSLGERQTALEYYSLALPILRKVGDRRVEALTLNHVGSIYSFLGDSQKALEYQSKALLLGQTLKDRDVEITVLYGIARTERDQNNLVEARAKIEAALDIVESLRTKLVSPGLRTSYFALAQKYYYFYIDVLMRLDQIHPGEGYDAMALHASERSRARVLLEMLIEAYKGIRQGVDPALLERERSVRRLLDAKAEQQTRLLSQSHTQQQAEQIKKETEQLLAQYQEIEAQIRAASPGYAALTQPRPLTVKQIQEEVVDADTMLLEYALGEDNTYLWAVTPDSVKTFVLPKLAEIEAAAQRAYDSFAKHNGRDKRGTARRQTRPTQMGSSDGEAASELSRMLLGPVAEHLGKKRLLIVANGVLSYLPFAALTAPDVHPRGLANASQPTAARAQPLIADHEIINLPSASALAVLRHEFAKRKPAPKSVAVLADPVFDKDDVRVRAAIRGKAKSSAEERGRREAKPLISSDSVSRSELLRATREVGLSDTQRLPRLPFSRQEAEAIYAISRQAKAMKALDFRANRETATSAELNQYRVVHFATHGLLNNEHPELSGLVLSLVDQQGKPQNGFLRLYDIYNMNLGAELVVLSACQTALGKQIGGEGLVGMTRGFMYAGAARVMASLWKVDDEATAELMKRFYRGMMREGQRPAAALRAAQLWMQKQKRWQSPYYWAGFTIQGEWK